jgi:Uma2 family endonuclease
MSTAAKLPKLMTVEEFLDWPGDGRKTKFDLVDGVPRAQDAPSDTHGTMHANVSSILQVHLRANLPGCRVVIGSGVEPRVRATWNYRIPDLAVTCGRNEKGSRRIPDPVIIIELLSPSNVAETWDNVRNYTTLPSVGEILIIDTTEVRAELLVRDAKGHWPPNPLVVTAGGSVPLNNINLIMLLNDAYQDTHLELP